MITHISCDCNLCFLPLSPILNPWGFFALSWFRSNKTLNSWTQSPATVQPNNLSSLYGSQKIKPKLLLGWGKDKRRCVLTAVWRFDVRLLQLLLCGWCLRFSSSFPVENTLLWRVWCGFDLSWCHFCWSWRNVSVQCIWQDFKRFDQMSALRLFFCCDDAHRSEWVCTAFSSRLPFFYGNLQSWLSSPASFWPEEP